MPEQQPSSQEVEKNKGYEIVKSIIPPLGLPSFESGRYILDIRLNRSWDEKRPFGEDELAFTDNSDAVAHALGRSASTIAWIEFFAKPEVTFRHSALAVGNGDHYHLDYRKHFPLETVTGQRFSVGENHYAVDYTDDTGIELKTHSQIVQEGELTPYMEEWLSRILSKNNRHHPVPRNVQPFANWLRKQRPDNDFSKLYFI